MGENVKKMQKRKSFKKLYQKSLLLKSRILSGKMWLASKMQKSHKGGEKLRGEIEKVMFNVDGGVWNVTYGKQGKTERFFLK